MAKDERLHELEFYHNGSQLKKLLDTSFTIRECAGHKTLGSHYHHYFANGSKPCTNLNTHTLYRVSNANGKFYAFEKPGKPFEGKPFNKSESEFIKENVPKGFFKV